MKRKALKAAFPQTIPVMTGYLFLGLAYGIYMNVSGFPFWYPLLTAMAIYGGSLEFLVASMLLTPFAPLQTFLMALLIQARHLFYGIAMLDRYKGLGIKRLYLIFGMSDETFSLAYTAPVPQGIDRGWFLFFITLLDQCYWITGATLGGMLGSLLTFNTQGLDFVMTAMFTVILVDQLKKEKRPYTELIGLGCSVACLALLGPDSFLLPAMGAILLLLSLLRKPIEKAGENA
ncbi:MAG: AzlC family ABC transporter permease [Clostridia bacterium]|nr:AzlC family ABC transporter permease [Clostridia bacterium]